MKMLADEILDILSVNPAPLSVIVARLGADAANVRRAAQALNDSGRALLVRRRRVLHLVSTVYPVRVCKNCYGEFEQPRYKNGKPSPRVTCSPFCHVSLTWKNPEARQKRIDGIRADRLTPAGRARLTAHNEQRWSKPEQHEKLSEQNRREWADPKKARKRAASIRAVNGSAEFRKLCSDIRKAYWQEPKLRDGHLAAIRAARRTPTARAAQSAANRRRYSEPASREKYLEVSRKNIAKATAAITGRKQTPEQIRLRTEKAKITRARNRAAATQGACI